MNTAAATRPKQDIDAPAPGEAKRDPRAVGDLRHMTVGYSAGCAAARARAGLGAPTRKRRSDSDIAPPSTMSAAPNQISSTSGLLLSRTTVMTSGSGSHNEGQSW